MGKPRLVNELKCYIVKYFIGLYNIFAFKEKVLFPNTIMLFTAHLIKSPNNKRYFCHRGACGIDYYGLISIA